MAQPVSLRLYTAKCETPMNYGKSSFLIGKSTNSMAIFNSYVKLPEGMMDYDVY